MGLHPRLHSDVEFSRFCRIPELSARFRKCTNQGAECANGGVRALNNADAQLKVRLVGSPRTPHIERIDPLAQRSYERLKI